MGVRGWVVVGALLAAAGGLYALLDAGGTEATDGGAAQHDERSSPTPPPVVLHGAPRVATTEGGAAPAPETSPATTGPTRRVRGRVVDEDGRPIAGAVVFPVGAAGPMEPARTNAEGEFDWTVPESVELAAVSAPGYAQFFLNLKVPLGPDARVLLRRPSAIEGIVVDESGAGLAQVTVTARTATSPDGANPVVARTQTDGTFRLEVVDAGPFVVQAGVTYTQAGTGDATFIPVRLESVPSGARDLRIVMRRGLSIEGRILDDAGALVTRAVTVDAVGRTATGDPDYTMRRGVLAKDGQLLLPGLAPGLYDLSFRVFPEPGDERGSDLSSTTVTGVSAGTEGLEIRMRRGAILTGRLVDDRGEPVLTTGYVYVYAQGRLGRDLVAHALVPGDGTFRAGPLDDAARYDLLATGFAGFGMATLPGVGPLDRDIGVSLPRAGRIAGRVVTTTGAAVPMGVPVGASADGVPASAPGSRLFGYTLADGTFSLDGLGDYSFFVEAGGGRSGYLATGVKSGVRTGMTDLVLEVTLGVELSGMLVDAAGNGVATTSLQADDGVRVGAMRPYAQVGSDGRFLLRGLRAGPVRLSAMIGSAWVPLGEVTAPGTDVRLTVPER